MSIIESLTDPNYVEPFWFVEDALAQEFLAFEVRNLTRLLADHPELDDLFDVPEATISQRRNCFALLYHGAVVDLLDEALLQRRAESPSLSEEESSANRRRLFIVPADPPGWVLETQRTISQAPSCIAGALPPVLRQVGCDPRDSARLEQVRQATAGIGVQWLEALTARAADSLWRRLARRWSAETGPAAPEQSVGVAKTGRGPSSRPFRNSPDFRSVTWNGKVFSFTARQAVIVQILFSAWSEGVPDVGQERLLEDLGASPRAMSVGRGIPNRVRDLFRGHTAWNSLIVKGKTRGSYRLALPDKQGHSA